MIQNKIHVWRAERKLTQQDLAELVGISRQTIIALEKNKYNPSLILAVKVANALGKPVMEVFSYEEEKI